MEKCCFMPHNDERFRFPSSRDWAYDSFVCKATKCVANENDFCIVPSLCKINEEGRCGNYRKKSNA